MNNALEEASAHLGAALAQALPSDDKIIIDHVREARKLIDAYEVAWKAIVAEETGWVIEHGRSQVSHPMTERESGNELADRCIEAIDRATKAEAALASMKEQLQTAEDDCDGHESDLEDAFRELASVQTALKKTEVERDAALGALAECRDEIARMKTPPITIFTGES